MEKIEIKSNRLKIYLEYELDKKQGEPIYREELDKITQISISGKSPAGEIECKDLSDLFYFRNLKSCFIKDFLVDDENIETINRLGKLETLHFDNCKFKNKIQKICIDVNRLILSFCTNVNISLYDVQNSITYLRITSGNKIDIRGIENFNKLEKLYLQSIKIKDLSNINKLDNLQYLNLNGSKIIKNYKCIDKLKAEVEYKKYNFPI